MRTCEHCGQRFNTRGLLRHQMTCGRAVGTPFLIAENYFQSLFNAFRQIILLVVNLAPRNGLLFFIYLGALAYVFSCGFNYLSSSVGSLSSLILSMGTIGKNVVKTAFNFLRGITTFFTKYDDIAKEGKIGSYDYSGKGYAEIFMDMITGRVNPGIDDGKKK